MRIIGQTDSLLYVKDGYNNININTGTSVDIGEIYKYTKKNRKTLSELTREEYHTFRR